MNNDNQNNYNRQEHRNLKHERQKSNDNSSNLRNGWLSNLSAGVRVCKYTNFKVAVFNQQHQYVERKSDFFFAKWTDILPLDYFF
jgi:hypothetical protein